MSSHASLAAALAVAHAVALAVAHAVALAVAHAAANSASVALPYIQRSVVSLHSLTRSSSVRCSQLLAHRSANNRIALS